MDFEKLVPVTCKCGERVWIESDYDRGEYPCGCDGRGRRGPGACDMSGQTYGMWKVLGLLRWTKGERHRYWLARCTGCRGLRRVRGDNLRSGASQACGSCRNRRRWALLNPDRMA